jgi:hypothetical protein
MRMRFTASSMACPACVVLGGKSPAAARGLRAVCAGWSAQSSPRPPQFPPRYLARCCSSEHQHDDLGADAFKFAIFDSPQHVLGLVAADAEIGGLIRTKIFLPISGPVVQPAVIESPRKSSPIGPAFARSRNEACKFWKRPLGSFFSSGADASTCFLRGSAAGSCAAAAGDAAMRASTSQPVRTWRGFINEWNSTGEGCCRLIPDTCVRSPAAATRSLGR